MILRINGGDYRAVSDSWSTNALFDFLGVTKDATGVQSNRRFAVSGDVELIASVPFLLTVDGGLKSDEARHGYPWTLSTFDLDRYGERIDPRGWDFNRYMENPVVQWAHKFDIPAIGKIEGLAIDNEGLHGFVYFNDKSFDAFGWSIGQRVKAGVIRAGSVGFRVMEIEIPDRKTTEDGTSLIFRKQELLEFSICNVPANPFALMKMRNEEIEKRNESCNNASPFWGSIINFTEGA